MEFNLSSYSKTAIQQLLNFLLRRFAVLVIPLIVRVEIVVHHTQRAAEAKIALAEAQDARGSIDHVSEWNCPDSRFIL